jgi:hypothetical protein
VLFLSKIAENLRKKKAQNEIQFSKNCENPLFSNSSQSFKFCGVFVFQSSRFMTFCSLQYGWSIGGEKDSSTANTRFFGSESFQYEDFFSLFVWGMESTLEKRS